MSLTIERAGDDLNSFGNYKYRILENGRLIAHYWHDSFASAAGIISSTSNDAPAACSASASAFSLSAAVLACARCPLRWRTDCTNYWLI